MPKHKLTLKGLELSTDYALLWQLINDGYRIPAYLVYTDEYPEPIWDIVDVKFRNGDYYIGTRGRGYESTKEGFESLIIVCEMNSLHFVLPKEIKENKKEEIEAKMKSLAIPFTDEDWGNLVSATPFQNRIAQILIEKEIYPIIEEADIKAMHLESQEHWIRILKNEEQPYAFHQEPEKRNLEHIVAWLGVTMCDIYGMCLKVQNGGTDACNCESENSEKRWRKPV